MKLLTGRDAAWFLLGYYAGLVGSGRRVPEYIKKQAAEAGDIVSGGSFRGPLAIYEMEALANKLRVQVAEKLNSPSAP